MCMYTVERILSENLVLLEQEDGSLIKIEADTSGIREGDLVTLQGDVLLPNPEETQRRKAGIRSRFQKLKKH